LHSNQAHAYIDKLPQNVVDKIEKRVRFLFDSSSQGINLQLSGILQIADGTDAAQNHSQDMHETAQQARIVG
jgi:hypothetical protein